MPKPVRKAVFPVAGLGTRVLPATKAIPKEMLPVVDRPLIQYVVEEALAAGIEQLVFVTGRGKSAIEDHFDHAFELNETLRRREKTALLEAADAMVPPPGNMIYVRQQEPLGLGHAVWAARNAVGDEPFAVILPDVLIDPPGVALADLIDVHARTGGNVLTVLEVPREQTDRYGIVETGEDDGRVAEVRGLVEKPKPAEAPSTLSILGRYVLMPEIFELLDRQKPGAGNEIQLTDAMAAMIGQWPFHAVRTRARTFDCGDKVGLLEANVAYALDRPDIGDQARAILSKYR